MMDKMIAQAMEDLRINEDLTFLRAIPQQIDNNHIIKRVYKTILKEKAEATVTRIRDDAFIVKTPEVSWYLLEPK